MEYNSFYGGRRGASFVIVKKYATIKEMVKEFKKGGDYKTVNYDEYVLIDTTNKNDKDNGKIYRRGYEYTNDLGGAIFVGQIVGPSGPAPHTLMTTIAEVDAITKQDGLVDDDGNTYRRTEGKYKPTTNLVPGAKGSYGNRTFDDTTDSIQWAAVSVRDANSYESTVHVGFKFPYTIIDYTTTSVSTYKNGDYADTSAATRTDDGSHPFYEKWNISIPKGVKGDALKNFRVVTASTAVEPYTGRDDDIAHNRKILVYDYYVYDAKEAGTYKTYYVGDFNRIKSVNVTDQGLITIAFDHDDDAQFQLRIPTNVTINTGSTEGTGTQKVVIHYADGSSNEIGNGLNYVMKTAIDNRYHLLVYYADPSKRAAAAVKATWEDKNDWTDLGYIGDGTGVGAIAGKESDSGVSSVAATMPVYSAWLIVEEDN